MSSSEAAGSKKLDCNIRDRLHCHTIDHLTFRRFSFGHCTSYSSLDCTFHLSLWYIYKSLMLYIDGVRRSALIVASSAGCITIPNSTRRMTAWMALAAQHHIVFHRLSHSGRTAQEARCKAESRVRRDIIQYSAISAKKTLLLSHTGTLPP